MKSSPIRGDVEEKALTSPFKCDRPKDVKMVMIHALCSQFTSTLILAQLCVIACYVDHVEPEEQRDHDKVWEECSEPDNLPGGMETLIKFGDFYVRQTQTKSISMSRY